MGVKPRPAKQARVDLTFTSTAEETLGKSTKVSTEISGKEIYFQLEEEINVVPATLEKVVVNERTSGIYDRTSSNEKIDLFFAPFGNEIQKDCALYLGFVLNKNAVQDTSLKNLNLMSYLYEKDLIQIKKYESEQAYKIENTGLKWEFWTGYKWELVIPQDETQGFRNSGKIIFKNLEGWTASQTIPELEYNSLINITDPLFWLRCVVEDLHYEYPPRIENLRLNTVSAIHGMRVKDDNLEIVSNGLPGQVLELKGTPVVNNTLKLSIEEERWVEVHNFEISGPFDKHFVLDTQKGEIKFGNGKKGIVPSRGSVITVMKCLITGYKERINEGLQDKSFKFNENSPLSGLTFKLLVEGDEWTEVDDFERSEPSDKHFVLNRENGRIKFGNGKKGAIPPIGSTIKLMKCLITGYEEWTSEGLQDQTFKLNETPLPPELIFKVIVEEDKWTEVDDFEGSWPSDKHFVLNKEKGEIKFGDGLMGFIPSQGSIIRVLEYMTGGGEEGNLMPERSWKIYTNFNGSVRNDLASTGGKDAQSIEEAIEDFCRDLKTPYTAVTLKDFEQLATNTPGLRIAQAKAIPNYDPDFPDPKNFEDNMESVTVVIIPYTPLEVLKIPPEPSEEFKKAVIVHLDKHRIIGTDIHVISPIYVKVSVNVTVVPLDSFRDDSLIVKKILEKLNRFLHPIKGGVDEKGWPIGRDVYLSELYDIIDNLEGVNCVTRLSVSGDKGAGTDSCGNLIFNSRLVSVYSGIHNVEIVRETDQCLKRGDSYSGK